MLIKIFSTAALLIMSWQTVVNNNIREEVRALQSSVQETQSFVRQDMSSIGQTNFAETKKISENLEAYVNLQEENLAASKRIEGETEVLQAKLKSTQKKLASKESELEKANDLAALSGAYAEVLQAEVFGIRKNGAAASRTLLATKEAIYKSGSKFPKHKDTLRKLMGPIDLLAGQWKRGDYSGSSIEIRKKLKSVIDARGA